MSQPPSPSLAGQLQPPSPSVADQPRDESGEPSSHCSSEEIRQFLSQPSQSVLKQKRNLNGRLAHHFENGKSLRKGPLHVQLLSFQPSNAPALALTSMYDKLIRTRRKRVIQGMDVPSAPVNVNGPRPTSAPLSGKMGPKIRSSTAVPRCEFTFAQPSPAVVPGGTQNIPAAGPSNQRTREDIIYIVKVVYARFHNLSTLMSDEDAWAFWTNLNDGERSELFEHYQNLCADPSWNNAPQSSHPDHGAQVADQPHIPSLDSQPPGGEHGSYHQPPQPSSEVGLHPDPLTSAGGAPPLMGPSNEPTQEEIIYAIKVVHAQHHNTSTFMSNEAAWTLWVDWDVQKRHQLFGHFQEILANSSRGMVPQATDIEMGAENVDQQEQHTVQGVQGFEQSQAHHPLHHASSMPMAMQTRPSSPARQFGREPHPPEPHPSEVRDCEAPLPQRRCEQGPPPPQPRPHTAVQTDPPAPPRHLSPHPPPPSHNPSGPSSQRIAESHPVQVWQQQSQDPSRPPTVMSARRPAERHAPHEGTYPARPPLQQEAEQGPPLPQPRPHTAVQTDPPAPPRHLPPHPPPPSHNPSGPSSQRIAESHPVQVWQQQSQDPSRQPTVMPTRHPAERYAPHETGYRPPPPPSLHQQSNNPQVEYQWQSTLRQPHFRHQLPQAIPLPPALPYPSREWGLEGSNDHQLANGWTAPQPRVAQGQPPLQPGATTGYQLQPPPPSHPFTDQRSRALQRSSGPQYLQDGAIQQAPYGIQSRNVPQSHTAAPPQLFRTFPPPPPHGQGRVARLTQEGGPTPQQRHPFGYLSETHSQIPAQSQSHMQDMLQNPPRQPPLAASPATHVMHYPVPSRPGPPPTYLTGLETSSQGTYGDDGDRMTEETMTQGTAEVWEDSQATSFTGTTDFGPRRDKGKSRAVDVVTNDFHQEGLGNFSMPEWNYDRSTLTHGTEQTEIPLNQRPQRNDVPQFVNSDGTMLVINQLQSLTNAVHDSARTQTQFSKEFMLFREIFQSGTRGGGPSTSSGARLGVSQKRPGQSRTAQQRKLDDNSLRARKRQKRVNDKVQRLRGQSKYDHGDEADDEDDEDDGAANQDELEEEDEHLRQLRACVQHSLTSFLQIYDWSTVAHQYPTLTEQEQEDYKQRKEYIVPTLLDNFRPDFSLAWKRHPFNKENRHVFIQKFLARVEGGAYFKHPTPKEMLTHDCIGFVLDNHMKYCRQRWHRSLCPLSPERLAQLAKGEAQRSRRKTLHESREVLLVRRGYDNHRGLFRLLQPCNMSSDETDGEKTADSNYRIIVSRWQSQELRNFLWAIDGYYRHDWAHPHHRRTMGGNRPRTRVLREGYSEDGIAPIGLWRNCYDKDWLAGQPAYILRELEILDEDYDFSLRIDESTT